MNFSNRLTSHFAAAAAVATLVTAANAQVATTLINQVVPANIDGLYINVETGAVGTSGSSVPGWDINPYSATALTWYNASGTGMMRLPGVTTGSAGNLPLTTLVDATGSFGSGSVVVGSNPGNWVLNADNYFGFRFTASDSQTHYAWGRMTVGATITQRTLQEIYWEQTPGVGITVGDTGGPAGTPATSQAYGNGCGASKASFYELFAATSAVDLSNTAFRMAFNGVGYTVSSSAAAFVAPSQTATNLGLGDDSETGITLSANLPYPGGTTNTLNVASNGHISVSSNGAAGDYSPTAAEFLGWNSPAWAVWRDFICNGTENVYFEEVGGVAYLTWLNVVGYNGAGAGTTPSTFQFQFNLGTGNVDFVFQSLDTVSASNYGDQWVVGFSSAGPSIDPGSMDITTGLPVTLPGADVQALALSANARPVTGTAVTYTVANVPAPAQVAFLCLNLGTIDPGVDLYFFGMPGCKKYVSPVGLAVIVLLGQPTITYNFNVPNNPTLIGFPLDAQAFAPAPGVNPTGFISSNGIASVFGDV